MMPDATYTSVPDLAPARYLQRAGQWQAALDLIAGKHDPLAVRLRAEIVVERYLWCLGRPDDAHAAIKSVDDETLATMLTAQLEYWRRLFTLDGEPGDDPVAAFAEVATDPVLGAWGTFWHAVAMENLHDDGDASAAGYAKARQLAPDDRLLESYVLRHQGDQLSHRQGNPEAGIALIRKSLQLRAALGARPQVAAAQMQLAGELPPGQEADELRAIVRETARELNIPWLQR
jgi:hypothetical protein